MRVDLLITELEVGGAERCLVALALYLVRHGQDVRVISLGPRPAKEKSQLVEQLEQQSIEVAFLDAKRMIDFPQTWRRLRHLVKSRPPDMAQAFLFHAHLFANLVYPPFRVPWMGGYRVAEPRTWRFPLERWASQSMVAAVCVSESVRRWCEERVGISGGKLIVIGNGVEPTRGRQSEVASSPTNLRATLGIPASQPIWLFVGRLVEQKGIDRIVAALPRLQEACPHWRLVVVGEGPCRSSMLSTLDKLAVQKKIDRERVHVVGFSESPRAWMQESELLLLPTRYEGMPNVVMETMAEGKAVATMLVEGVQEVLGESAKQQAVEPGDVEAWTKLVIALSHDTGLREQLGTDNQKRMESLFAWDTLLQKYLYLYQNHAKPPID